MKKLLFILLTTVLLSSCVTKIDTLKADPSGYAGKIVTVRGEVTNIINIPIIDFSFIELTDSTDNILIFTSKSYEKHSNLSMKAKVVAFNPENMDNATTDIIRAIEEFLIKENLTEKDSITTVSNSINNILKTILYKLELTYFLIEQE